MACPRTPPESRSCSADTTLDDARSAWAEFVSLVSAVSLSAAGDRLGIQATRATAPKSGDFDARNYENRAFIFLHDALAGHSFFAETRVAVGTNLTSAARCWRSRLSGPPASLVHQPPLPWRIAVGAAPHLGVAVGPKPGIPALLTVDRRRKTSAMGRHLRRTTHRQIAW
jgi:hypothetical protein